MQKRHSPIFLIVAFDVERTTCDLLLLRGITSEGTTEEAGFNCFHYIKNIIPQNFSGATKKTAYNVHFSTMCLAFYLRPPVVNAIRQESRQCSFLIFPFSSAVIVRTV